MRRPIAGALAVLVLLSAAAEVVAQTKRRPEPKGAARGPAPRGQLPPAEQAVVSLFERAAPSVVYVTTEQARASGLFAAEAGRGAGSGFVWDAQGHIVTSHHAVEDAARVNVQLDAGAPLEARVVGAAPEYDLALVKLDAAPKDIRPIPLGTSSDLKIGQSVFAIGNPFGLQRTLTHGIVSALDRDLPAAGYREVAGAIQTDAQIDSGSSGGPLLDSAGRLIGVNVAVRTDGGGSAAAGYAVPVDLVNRIVVALIARGRAPWPGIGIDPLRPDLAARAGLAGVVILNVRRGSPAAEAGLRGIDQRSGALGDVIAAVNGRPVDTLSTFVGELDRVGVGGTAELTVVRGGRERQVKVRVIDLRE